DAARARGSGTLLFRAPARVRRHGGCEALHAGGRAAVGRAARTSGARRAIHGARARGRLPTARGRHGPQARRSRSAHATGRHPPHRVAAAVRRAGAAGTRGDAHAPARRARRRGQRLDPHVRLLLARHAESVWNAERRFQGRTDIALSARGRAQAEALGRALRGYGVAAAYVSPFRRARETAELALAGTGLPPVALQDLPHPSLPDPP